MLKDHILGAIIILLIAVFIVYASGHVVAQTPPPIPDDPDATPQPTAPPSSGGNGGGGGGGGYSPPAFQPYSLPVHTSSGTTIGSVEGKSMYDIELSTASASTIDINTYSITYTASLNSKPSNFWLNLGIEPTSTNGIPLGMHDVQPLIVINITNNGLDIKGGTSVMSLVMPRAALGSTDSSTVFYLLRYDGNYQIQGVSPVDSNNGNVSFNINPSSSSGFYTLVKTLPIATPTPAPSATPVPTPTPTPTPEPSNNMGIYLALIGTAVGAIVGAAVVFFVKK